MLIITKLMRIMKSLNNIIVVSLLLASSLIGQEIDVDLKIFSQKNNSNLWWMNQNNNGKNLEKNGLEISFVYKKNKQTLKINASNQYNNSFLGESFFEYKISSYSFIKIGTYYKDFSTYLNEDLSTGSLIVSQNAKPFKKIGFVTEYPMKKVVFRFGMLHGRLKKNNIYNEAPNVHEKFIYLDLKDKNEKKFSLGLVHSALWGGSTYENGEFPDSFSDFLKVFISADGPPDNGPHPNALGSHIGIWDFVYYKKISKKIHSKIYYQHFFEDTSSFRFSNEIDGLWGIELSNKINNSSVLFEYIDTTHSDLNPPYQADTYYWNYQYQDGWRYENHIIGNPFINPESGPRGVYGHDQRKVVHIGAQIFLLNDYKLKFKATKITNQSSDFLHEVTLEKKLSELLKISFTNYGNGKNMSPEINLTYLIY